MKKIAFINQRYGSEICGGSEYYTRLIAERLTKYFEVTVLTSCAKNSQSWKNEYVQGESVMNDVTVMRFPVEHERAKDFPQLTQKLMININDQDLQQCWIDAQGPRCNGLVDYLRENRDNYDVFIFVTYLYYPQVMGYEYVKEKAVFIPTAHDEPYIYLSQYRKMFTQMKYIVYLTEEEKEFVEKLTNNAFIPNAVMGVGVDIPSPINSGYIANKYGINQYITYVGRIEEGKSCGELFDHFIAYKRTHQDALKLLVAGSQAMKIPKHEDIIYLGFISEQEKFDLIAGAIALILPSKFESLSIAVLEALAISIPVIVNGECEVLKGHCIKSNAGLYYANSMEFSGILKYLLDHPRTYKRMKENALCYVDTYYKWENIIDRFCEIINAI